MLESVKFAAAGFAACALATAPLAAQLISYRYDGVYLGSATPAEFSAPACGALPLYRIEIENGILRAWDGERQTVKGFVTHDGFFNADYYFPGGRGTVFEGMIDAGGRLTGGIFRGECAWVVELSKAR